MNLKDWINNHQLPTIMTVVVATSVTTAGAVNFFATKGYELKESKLQQEYARKTEQLGEDYQTRLRSLELRIGEQKEFFDVTRVLIPPAAVYKLPPTAQRFNLSQNIEFFVDDYPGGEWEFIRSNEFDLTAMMVGEKQAIREARSLGLLDQLKQSQIFLFRHPESFTLNLRGRIRLAGAASKLTFFPVIAVQPVEHAWIAETFGRQKLQVAQLLDSAQQSDDQRYQAAAARKVATILDDTFRSDFAGYVMKSVVDQGFKYVEEYENTFYQIEDLQKKRNILFLHSTLVFRDAMLATGNQTSDLQVEEHVLFVNGIDRSFLIRSLVPSFRGESRHYDWVRRWLTGFRVVWS